MNETLTESPRAHGLTPELVSAIVGVCNCRTVGAGERIYSAGEPADSVYIVLSGRVQGTRLSRDGSSTIIGEAGRGDSVGMLALEAAPVQLYRELRMIRFLRSCSIPYLAAYELENWQIYPRVLTSHSAVLTVVVFGESQIFDQGVDQG